MINLTVEEVAQLLKRYSEGHCTENEKSLVEEWYMQFNEDPADYPIKNLEKLKAKIAASLPHLL